MDDTTKTPEQETINEQENVVMNDDGYIASGGKIEEVDLTNKMKDSYINCNCTARAAGRKGRPETGTPENPVRHAGSRNDFQPSL